MSVSIHLSSSNGEAELVNLVGANELDFLWMPIVEGNQLAYLDYCFSAGLTIDAENYSDVVAEFEVLCMQLANESQGDDSVESPVFRCKRCLRILNENDPAKNKDVSLYIG